MSTYGLPTPTLSWEYSLNNAWGTGAGAVGDAYDCLYHISEALLNCGATPWTCWGSCAKSGGVTWNVSNSGVNYWTAGTDLAHGSAANNRSWIVLQHSALSSSGKAAICLENTGTQTYYATVVFSPSAGFGLANGGTDGLVNARPTASDEIVLSITGFGANLNTTGKAHVMIGDSGAATRIFVTRNSVVSLFAIFDQAIGPASYFTNPVVGAWFGQSAASNAPTIQNICSLYAPQTRINGEIVRTLLGVDGYNNVLVPSAITAVSDWSSAWPMCPIRGVYAADYYNWSKQKGKLARGLADLWIGCTSATIVPGDTFPLVGNAQFVQLRDLILPNNNTAISMT